MFAAIYNFLTASQSRMADDSDHKGMADEIGFHAIWNKEFHNCRPTTWCEREDYAAGHGYSRLRQFIHAVQVHPWEGLD